MSLQGFAADLHIHSALSPCAEREMDPPRVFARALELGLDIMAITDHNAVANLPAFCADAPRGLWVVPGVEFQTREEIHLVCLFGELAAAMDFGDTIRKHLPDLANSERIFGEQTVVTQQGRTVGVEPRMLLNSTDLGVDEVYPLVASYGGLCYPAHVDRNSYSIRSQLGFIPPNLPVPTVEISYRTEGAVGREQFPGYQLVQSSDAHCLAEMGRGCAVLQLEAAVWEELAAAFFRRQGREIQV